MFRKNLKKYLIPVLFFLLFSPKNLSAESNLRRVYLNQRDNYFQVHNQFLSARSNYWQLGTIKTKERFYDASKEFLLVRDDLISRYFDWVLERSSFVDIESRQNLISWQGWINEHQKRVRRVDGLEDLIILSAEFDQVYPEIEYSIYVFLFNRVVTQQKEIKNEIIQLSQEMAEEASADDWQIEVNNQINQAESYWDEAEQDLDRVRVIRPGDMKKNWNTTEEKLNLAQSSLSRAMAFLDEVISKNEIK